jgi:nitroreductase
MNDTIDLLHRHRSIRKFTDQPIPQETLDALIRAGQAAATSGFIQACTVIQVNDADKREKLAEYAGGQAYVASAAAFLVFCADMQRHKLVCDMHNAEMLSGYAEQFITATVDTTLLAQNVVVAAESIGLGTCYIGGIRNNPEKVCELLELPELTYPVFGLCLGYPAQDPEVKPRLPLEVILKQDRYNDDGDAEVIREYDESVREYYRTRTGNNKQQGWSEQMSDRLVKESRPFMLNFLKSRKFTIK